jgi:hypothetical protein
MPGKSLIFYIAERKVGEKSGNEHEVFIALL